MRLMSLCKLRLTVFAADQRALQYALGRIRLDSDPTARSPYHQNVVLLHREVVQEDYG